MLVLEIAFNRKGDLAYMARLLRPNAVVINDMQPVGGKYFVHEKQALEEEYLEMVRKGSKKDVVIINESLPEREKVRNATRRSVLEYSVNGSALYNATSDGNEITVSTAHENKLYMTSIPGDAVKAAYAIATILKEITEGTRTIV